MSLDKKVNISYKGKSINTSCYKPMSDELFNKLKKEYFKKPNIDEVRKALKTTVGDGKSLTTINKYYFLDLMTKVTLYNAKWCVEDVFNHKPLLEQFYGRVYSNDDVFDKKAPLLTNIKKAIDLAGAGIAKIPTNFKIDTVRKVLQKYNLNDNYYDMSCGWGVRLMGSLSVGVNYFGTDPNNLLVDRLKDLASEMQDVDLFAPSVDIRCQGSEEYIEEWDNTMGVCFTSPPYFNLEDYGIGEKQSIKQNPNYEDWLNKYYKPTMENCYKYLIKGGAMLINIKNFGKYDLEEKTIELAKQVGFTFVGTENFENISRIGTDGELIENNEYIYVFRKD